MKQKLIHPPEGRRTRLTPSCAMLFLKIMQRLAEVRLTSEKVDIPLFNRFSAVIVEDRTSITLPAEVAEVWQGCGKEGSPRSAAVKALVRWDVSNGELMGPQLTNGRRNDHKSPFEREALPEGSVYSADLGFFGSERLCQIAREKKGKRYFVTRLQAKTHLFTRRGHRIQLAGMLPKRVGQVREGGAVLGQKNGVPVRLLMVNVPEEVAKERQERIQRTAQKNGDVPSKEILALAHWTIVITNIPRTRADDADILV
jgi:hypothetical protein